MLERENRHIRAARAIAATLEIEPYVIVDVSTTEQDSHIFTVTMHLIRFGSYCIEYLNNGTAKIWKWGR